jgi:MFS family permease
LQNHWAVASLTGGGIFVTFLLRNNISPLTTTLKVQLNINDFQVGLVLSSFLWVYTFLQPLAGWATDNYGARTTLLVGVMAASGVTILTGFATSFIALICLRVGLGVAQSPNFVTGAKVSSSNWIDESHRAQATSVWVAGGRLGTAVSIPLATIILLYLGWQWAFFGTGLLGIAWCGLWFLGFRDNPEDVPNSKLPLEKRIGLRESLPLLASPLGLGLAAASFGQGYLAYYLSTWLPNYLVRDQNFSILGAGLFAVLPILSAVVTMVIVGGFLSDRGVREGASPVGFRRKLFSLGMATASVLLFVTAYARTIAAITSISSLSSPYFVVSTLSLAGAAWGIATPSLWAALVEATPREVTGSMGGVMNLGGNLGGIVVLTLTGYILQATGQSFLALVMVGLLSMIAAVSAMLFVKPIVLDRGL